MTITVEAPGRQFRLTPRIVAAVAHEEGLVLEAYRDSVGIWTWGLGVTGQSGHTVYPRYKDAPTSIERALEVSVWLMQTRYLPTVQQAFRGFRLKEHELAAALSFHWNTGAIARASWVKLWREGNVTGARAAILDWARPAELFGRRKRECSLFFDDIWPDLKVPIYPVAKPSYRPKTGAAKLLDVMPLLEQLMGGA